MTELTSNPLRYSEVRQSSVEAVSISKQVLFFPSLDTPAAWRMTRTSIDNDHHAVFQQQGISVMSEIRQLYKNTYLYLQTKIYSIFSIPFPLSLSFHVFSMLRLLFHPFILKLYFILISFDCFRPSVPLQLFRDSGQALRNIPVLCTSILHLFCILTRAHGAQTCYVVSTVTQQNLLVGGTTCLLVLKMLRIKWTI
jgi:hypothetical protein